MTTRLCYLTAYRNVKLVKLKTKQSVTPKKVRCFINVFYSLNFFKPIAETVINLLIVFQLKAVVGASVKKATTEVVKPATILTSVILA